MKKITVTVLMITAFFFSANAQGGPAKAMFFEIGGPGLASFNYDMRFSNKEGGFGGRIGFGGFSVQNQGALFLPVGVNYLFGKDNMHYFELGANITPVFIKDDFDGNFNTTFGSLNFGYRLQPKNGGFFFRASINPVFSKDFIIPYYGGISFGYKF